MLTFGGAGGLDEVVGQGDVPAGDFTEGLDAGFAVAGFGADAGADGGGTHVDGEEFVGGIAEVGHLATQGGGKTAEGLSKGHGDGVLQLGAAHLDDVGKLLGFLVEGVDHLLQMGHEGKVFETHGHVDGAGVGVVGALRGVDNVVGRAVLVFAALVAHTFKCKVGDYFVGSHVGAGAGTALYHVDGELVVETSRDELVAGPADGLALFGGDHAHFHVGHGGGFLGDGHAFDEVGIAAEQVSTDVEVVYGTAGLNTVVHLFGNFF